MISDENNNQRELFHPLLPKLKKNPRLNFPNAGKWDSRGITVMDDLSVSLKVERESPLFEINAVPDMWARPLLFEMALFDKSHLLYPRILGEWRGLLAMLALKELRSIFSLSVKPVTISANQPNRSPKFGTALDKMKPGAHLADDTTWNNLNIILFGNQPIGMTSPTTLVCTAVNYSKRIQNVAWFEEKNQYLVDPVPFLNLREKKDLAGWLINLRNGVLGHKSLQNEDNMKIQLLVRLFDEFIVDLNTGISESKLVFQESQAGYGMTDGLFRLLDRPIHGDPIDPKSSHVRLEPSSGKNPKRTLLVIDKGLAKQWKESEQDIKVIASTTLASFPFSEIDSNRREFAGTILPEGLELRLPEDFFTEKFFVIAQQEALPGEIKGIKGADNLKFQGDVITPIIPLNPEILDYLSRNDLYQRIRFESTTNGFKVYLRLPLSGNGGKSREFEIEHEYRIGNGDVVKFDNLPILEIWPNFETPSWKVYYTYYDTLGHQNTFYAKPKILEEPLNEANSFKNQKNTEVKINITGNTKNSRSFENRGVLEREITCTETFPEALTCKAMVTNNLVTAGIILLSPPLPITQIPTESWIFGIDFGTTGTHVFAGPENIEPQPVIFSERLMQITASGGARPNLYKYFIQDDPDRTSAFLSIFHDFQFYSLKQIQSSQGLFEPILDGHIYFLPNVEEFRARMPGIIVDLKWGSTDERPRAQAFLEQLCIQCAAEAVLKGAKSISWRFSFPTAFSISDREDFIHIWNTICKQCNQKRLFKYFWLCIKGILVSQSIIISIINLP